MRAGLAGLAVALALVGATSCGPRASSNSAPAGSQVSGTLIPTPPRTASASATPTGGPATFFIVRTGSLSALSVYDWNGDLRGHGTAAVPLGCCAVVQSPDGSVLEVGTSTGAVVLGRFGNLVENLTGPVLEGIWAQDDVHSCVVGQDGRDSPEGTLYIVGPGIQSTKVVTVHGFGPHEGTGVVICNVADNFAILATIFMGGVETLTKVRLSDGATVWEQKANASTGPCGPSNVISQSDTYEAEGSANEGFVCDLATGRVVAHLHGDPLAISWEGHVVIESLFTPPNAFSLEAVDWQTGTVLWRNQSAAERHGQVPEIQAQDEPNADGIALTTVPNPGADYSQDIAELWLIRPGYAARQLSNQAEPGVL
jgi:hypothetical protein